MVHSSRGARSAGAFGPSGRGDTSGMRLKEETTMARLMDLAQTIRSKNAGPDCITFDIIFSDQAVYEEVKTNAALTRERIAALFGIDVARIVTFVAFDPARAIKFTIKRVRPSGSPGETDVMGSQMYAPLLELEIPVTEALLRQLVA